MTDVAATLADPSDRMLAAFRKLAMLTFPAIRFFAPWAYVVREINGDGTVNASPADTEAGMPDIGHAPIRAGLPGATVKPAVGSACVVAFLNGDPGNARVVDFDQASAQSVTLDTGTGSSEHLMTAEATVNLMLYVLTYLALNGAFVGTGGAIVPDTALATAIASAAAANIGATASYAALLTALAAKTGDMSGTKPGLGCPHLGGG